MGELQSDFGARSIATCRRSVLKNNETQLHSHTQQEEDEVDEEEAAATAAIVLFFCLYIILFLFCFGATYDLYFCQTSLMNLKPKAKKHELLANGKKD